MSTANKLTYLNGTKQKLRQAINNLGGSIDDETTFRDYANILFNIYDLLPKTEYQMGSSINLGKTLKGKLDFEKDETTGKNLFDFDKFKEDNSSATITGTNNNFYYTYTDIYSYINIPFKANTQYHISGNWSTTKGNGNVRIYYTDETYENVFDNYSDTNASGTINFTSNSNKSIDKIGIKTFGTGNWTFINLQIEEGTEATSYEPYQIVPLPKLMYGDTSQDSTNGYNLWGGFNDVTLGNYTTKKDGTITYNNPNSGSTSATTAQAIPNNLLLTLSSGSYTISTIGLNENLQLNVVKRTPNTTSGNIIRTISHTNPNGTISLTEESEIFLRIGALNTFTGSGTVYIMLEAGETVHNYEPYTNGASPNPSYPQKIQVATGTQNVLVRGKNLFKPILINNGSGIVRANCSIVLNEDEFVFTATGSDMYFGDVTGTGNSYINGKGIKIDVTGQSAIYYYITNTNFKNNYITAYDSNNVSLGYTYKGSNKGSYTIPSGASYITLRIGLSATSGTEYRTKIQVTYGSTEDTTYEPYIEPTTQTLHLTGKNLLPNKRGASRTVNGITLTNNNNGSITLDGTSTAYTSFLDTENFTIKAGTYTLSITGITDNSLLAGQIRSTDGQNVYLSTSTEELRTYTFDEDTEVRYRTVVYSNKVINGITIYPMLESGTTATSYEPYNPIELAKIGDYADEIVYDLVADKWYKKKAIEKHKFTSTETYIGSGVTGVLCLSGISGYATTNNTIKCTHFNGISNKANASSFNDNSQENDIGFNNTTAPRLYIKTQMNITQLLSFFGNNDVYLYYALITPTLEEITDTTLIEELKNLYNMQSIEGTTIIETSGDLPIILKVRAIKG